MTCSGGPYENRERRRFRAGARLSTAISIMRLLKGASEGIRRGLCRDRTVVALTMLSFIIDQRPRPIRHAPGRPVGTSRRPIARSRIGAIDRAERHLRSTGRPRTAAPPPSFSQRGERL
jgi:hypothetical protein